MNKQECDIMNVLLKEPYINQRILSEQSGHSLGIVNRSIKTLIQNQYLDEEIRPTEKAIQAFRGRTPKNAIILAAGFGMRMVPINTQTPKGLLEVKGEPLIERMIKQLHDVGIRKIYIVVGFMKEQYEYLIDEFGVELIVNPDYAAKNNLHSMNLILQHLSNSYIVPCDIWCAKNPFQNHELYSWYMVSDAMSTDSTVRVNRKKELALVSDEAQGNEMIGIAYLAEEEASIVRNNIVRLCADSRNDGKFWETALCNRDKMIVMAKVVHKSDVLEINTYEQLREFDSNSNHLKSNAISIISEALRVKESEITNITVLKKGMTNRSFLFRCMGKKYIMRIPGEGTEQLINRAEEAQVYGAIARERICDNIVYINPQNGYKITEYLEGARTCDLSNENDLKRCMSVLRQFHEKGLEVSHEFNLFEQIEFYESLWEGKPSIFRDYLKTKENVFSLQNYINDHIEKKVLTHIDAVPDNFLFAPNQDGEEEIRLIDWEYAGMQDPHLDIAMFCIYSLFNKEQVDQLIDYYFLEGCIPEIRTKIYCYIAVSGLLWSNWCEYKRSLGIEFGEYSLGQYRYAKDYYKYVQVELKKMEDNK